MINKTELNRIALLSGLDLYQQEKDYLLKLFLFYYYKRFDGAVFKGGTCLKYTLGVERFSEDLDFNIKNVSKFQQEVKEVLRKIRELGIENNFIKEESFADSYTCEIAFAGPLFDGKVQTRNKFRIDAGYRTGTFLKAQWKLIQSEFPEISGGFLVLTMHPEEILFLA
ncbi:nucleotidyl transferase AbiEii/AbiGii toxin family protein [Candidatus Woesearchaeota archaeon]|nr:nucleotidyl transferase AbiEii/AbiGii toxin family protein [Candidatus Woesearchaeota archaeon]